MTTETQDYFFQELEKARRELDRLDEKLLALLNRRLRISLRIGGIKRKNGKKIYDRKREEEILSKLKQKNKGPLKEGDLTKIFSTILQVSRKSQFEMNTGKN